MGKMKITERGFIAHSGFALPNIPLFHDSLFFAVRPVTLLPSRISISNHRGYVPKSFPLQR